MLQIDFLYEGKVDKKDLGRNPASSRTEKRTWINPERSQSPHRRTIFCS